jgi:hypothetical protein
MIHRTWILEDHLCRKCGGRILRCVTGSGMTPGGNPFYRCADCGFSGWGIDPSCVCWCGFNHRFNSNTFAYRCLPFSWIVGNELSEKQKRKLTAAFRNCGCDPERGEVGIILEAEYPNIFFEE